MIKQLNTLFMLQTKNTSYCFHVLPSGHLEHLHYGKKVMLDTSSLEAICEKNHFIAGNLLAYSNEYPQLGLENLCLEASSRGKGDIREPFVSLTFSNGSTTSDFIYEKATITEGKTPLRTLPSSYGTNQEVTELAIELYDKHYKVRLILYYWVYEDCDVIARSARLINESDTPLTIDRLMSTQLDIDHNDLVFTNFCGAWAREMNRFDHPCHQGKIINSSSTGTSSSRHNPFVMLSSPETSEDYGICYGFNLIYSGNHYEAVEVGSFGKTRFVSGINPDTFSFCLAPSESFEAPEAVMTFSANGYTQMSHQMHYFIRHHIVRGHWQFKERPILINSWEATYFNFNESKLLKLAKSAADVGIELFVLDDGWFGDRNDDTSSLGDWFVNKKKLPNGLNGLAEKINKLGMSFGIWVEPEMISEKSKCYEAHPDWAVTVPNMPHSVGRNQMILDLTRSDVQEYIITSLSDIFENAPISYVKWDMNRIFSDYFSRALESQKQKEFAHRYVLGLYHILDTLTKKFPEILFEGCSAGGNRFDLGILCYMPQIWASDNTDAICRANIQTSYSYGYPMSVISSHVSNCPNHQTLRTTPIETRFNVAGFGLLGYECNLSEMSKEDLDAIKKQVALYKKYRHTLQFGNYYRIANGKATDYTKGIYKWMTVSDDQKEALGCYLQEQVTPNYFYGTFKTKGLCDTALYHFTNRQLQHNIKAFGDLINTVAPIHVKQDSLVHNTIAKFVKMDGEIEDYTLSGSALNHIGIRLKQSFAGTGYDDQVRFFPDYASRLYIIEMAEPTSSHT